ncbi:type II secretion system protein E [Kangiella profundi]|uniref:Type II secretion system protein E n=1 Tax=Kangiella profundi TaxID=1561924 RepID=A0A2K9B0E7_9GAMM|nr:GspE/PulE family protein [Kangiella profundi]AUD78398.1 type II secretion system protein E [Kangiella profundi]GGF07617.1 type II secretion system protein E [Kangiella profundi]
MSSTLSSFQLLDLLKKANWISEEQFQASRIHLRQVNPKLHPIEQVADLSLTRHDDHRSIIDEELLTQFVAKLYKLPYEKIDPLKIDVDGVTRVMSLAYAQRHNILVIHVDKDAEVVKVAVMYPEDLSWRESLEQVLRMKIVPVMGNPALIKRYQKEFYLLSASVKGANDIKLQKDNTVTNLEQLIELKGAEEADANDQHIVQIVDWLLQYAFKERASDIHIEPRREVGRIRFRIDGVLHKVYELPISITHAVISRLKILGRMDLAERRKPLDGRVKTKSPDGSEIELRLSTLPTAFGEKFVGRIFDPTVLTRNFDELGLEAETEATWRDMISQPTGIVLLTGPTGSGKTTTLYTSLKLLATPEVNICTIEDPIEMVDPNLNQMQVHHDIDLDFAAGVRALLRQDPDIIMIGEIRDKETAQMAVQAALTGHLVISTLHTNDAPSAMTRLIEIGVEPYLLNATMLGVMAQRLVRTLCKYCKEEVSTDPLAWKALVGENQKVPMPEKIFHPVGCDRCRHTGYQGRQGIYELLKVTDDLKTLVYEGAQIRQLRKQGIADGMNLLRVSGAYKVAAGLTTIDEVLRVAPRDTK